VEEGKWADLVVVADNPLTDIDALAQVRHVFLGGEHVVQEGEMRSWYTW